MKDKTIKVSEKTYLKIRKFAFKRRQTIKETVRSAFSNKK